MRGWRRAGHNREQDNRAVERLEGKDLEAVDD